MSQYYGDIQLGDTIQWLFTTVNTTPVPTVLTSTPTATAYTDGGITQSATGVTVTADFDGVVGLNLMSVVATGANGFAAGENIEIVLDAGTVGGNTVIGYAVGSFSIENRSNLRPTTVGNNEVDVTATGAVGIDWSNVENPTTALDLSGTDIQLCDTTTTNTDVTALNDVAATDIVSSGAITTSGGAVTTVTTTGTATSVTTVAANGITTSSMATDSISAGTIASGELTNIENEIWDALMSSHITASTMGLAQNVGRANVATAGSASTITLDGGADTNADLYNGSIIELVNGPGIGQSRRIIDYTVSTRIATIEPDWIINPASGTEFIIRPGGNVDLRTASQTTLDNRMAEASINTTGGAVDTVTTVTNDVGITATAVNLIWDEAMTETTGAPAVTASFREALKWMFALSRNKVLQTATLTTLRNDADGADLATSVVADDAVTYTRNEWSV